MFSYNELLSKLKSHGLRITPQRRVLLTIFYTCSDKILSVPTLFEEATKEYSDLNLSTLYRNLQQLEALHIIHRLILEDGKDYFTLVCEEDHHHHIICTRCGKKIVLNYCPYNELLAAAASKNFKLTGHSILLYGLCNQCASKNHPE